MEFINIPTEQTTAATDAIVALVAIIASLLLRRYRSLDPKKTAIWIWVFGLLATAAILGSIAHGLALTESTRALLWYPLYLILGLLVALFVVATVYDLWGDIIASRLLPPMMFVGVIFFCATLVWPDDFFIFIGYEVAAMVFSFGGYLWLAFRGHLNGSRQIAIGIFISIIAAGVQAGKLVAFKVIWQFDHNGAYHLIQIVGIIFLILGLRASLTRSRPAINNKASNKSQ